MNSVKILHCADVHIGAAESSLGTLAQSRRAETLITFEKIVSLARDEHIDIMLISGDLFNSNNVEKVYTDRVFECLAQIPDVKIVVCCGNHDPLNAESPFKKYTLPNLYVLDTRDDYFEFGELGTRVYGKSFKEVYMKGEPRFSLQTDPSFINLMCIHGELRSDMGSDYNSITSSFIENSGMDYIALGHVHKRSDIAKIGDTYVSYCGCPEGQGFDELGEKGVYIGTVSKGSCDLLFVPTAKRMHLSESIDVTGLASSSDIAARALDVIRQKYPDNYMDNLYKFILTGQLEDGVSISAQEIATRLDSSVYFAKLRDKTEIKVDLEQLASEQSLKGIFVKNMLAKIETADEQQKDLLKAALNLGLKAFNGEVSYDET